QLEIDGLRSLRLLRSWRVRPERWCADVVRSQVRPARSHRVCARERIAGVRRSCFQSQQRRRFAGTKPNRWAVALDKVFSEELQVSARLEMFSPESVRDLGWRELR